MVTTALSISYNVFDTMCFLPFSHQYYATFFAKPPTTFLMCFTGERKRYAGMKVCLNWVLNPQQPDHELDTLSTEKRNIFGKGKK